MIANYIPKISIGFDGENEILKSSAHVVFGIYENIQYYQKEIG
jgi:hypothetical protein